MIKFIFKNTHNKKTEAMIRRERLIGMFCFAAYLTGLPFAARAGDLVATLNGFMGYLTGDLGKALAGLAIVGVGIGCLHMGKLPKSALIATVVGIGVIFGAQVILTALSAT